MRSVVSQFHRLCSLKALATFKNMWLHEITDVANRSSFRIGKGRSCADPSSRAIRRSSTVARLLRFWVLIPPEAWMSVRCEGSAFYSGRSLCDGLITRPEESYRLWCVVVCDLETSWMRRPWPTGGCCAKKKFEVVIPTGEKASLWYFITTDCFFTFFVAWRTFL